MAVYEVRVVDQAGTRIATLGNAIPGPVRWELNGPGAFEFSFPTRDADATQAANNAAVQLLTREVQLWRNGTVIFWGVPVRAEVDAEMVHVQCAGLLWYFSRRFIGPLVRESLLTNPHFEDGLVGWSAVGATATSDTEHKLSGLRSAKLVSSSAGADNYLGQTYPGWQSDAIHGTTFTLVGWFRVDDNGWVGPALDSRGLYLERRSGSTVTDRVFAEISDDTPRGSWQRLDLQMYMPVNRTEDLEVRLYSPGGTIRWDKVFFTWIASFTYLNYDLGEIVAELVRHLQDAWDKSDLNIAVDVPLTGIRGDRSWPFAEHHRCLEVLQEFAEAGYLDFDIVWNAAGTTRTFTGYAPRKGVPRPHRAMTTAQMTGFTLRTDGRAATSALTVQGEGHDIDREEGQAVDRSVFGGLILEDIESAPPGTLVTDLDALAAEKIRTRLRPEVLEVTTAEALWPLIGEVSVGDTLPVTIDHGWAQTAGDWRITEMGLDPPTDAVSLSLNRA